MRTLKVIAITLASFASVESISAAVINKSTNVSIVSPLPDMRQGNLESDSTIYLLPERQRYWLPNSVAVDITSPGAVPGSEDKGLSEGTIEAGQFIDNYLLHVDSISGDSDDPADIVEYLGSITFDQDIIGIIVRVSNMDESNLTLGLPGTTYAHGVNRSLELVPDGVGVVAPDAIMLSADRRTISMDIRNGNSIDEFRIVTAVPEFNSVSLVAVVGILAAVSVLARRMRRIIGTPM